MKAVELPVKSRGRGRPRTRPIGEPRPADARRARKEKQLVEKEAAPTRVLRKRGVSKEDVEADDEEDMTLGELAKRSKSSTRDASEVREKPSPATTDDQVVQPADQPPVVRL